MEGLSLHLTSSYTILFEDQCGKSKGRCWRWQQYPFGYQNQIRKEVFLPTNESVEEVGAATYASNVACRRDEDDSDSYDDE